MADKEILTSRQLIEQALKNVEQNHDEYETLKSKYDCRVNDLKCLMETVESLKNKNKILEQQQLCETKRLASNMKHKDRAQALQTKLANTVETFKTEKSKQHSSIKTQMEALKMVTKTYSQQLAWHIKFIENIDKENNPDIYFVKVNLFKNYYVTLKGRSDIGWTFVETVPKLPDDVIQSFKDYDLSALMSTIRECFQTMMIETDFKK